MVIGFRSPIRRGDRNNFAANCSPRRVSSRFSADVRRQKRKKFDPEKDRKGETFLTIDLMLHRWERRLIIYKKNG